MRRVAAIAVAITLLGAADSAAARRPNMPDGWKWPPTREMRREGRKCLADLKAMGINFKKARKTRKITTPIEVLDMRFGNLLLVPTFRKPPFVMDCRLARGIAEHADLITSLGISELRFSTIYQYRKVRTRRGRGARGALSRHALGLAMDIFELGMANGTKVVVEDDYWIHPTLVMTELALRTTGGFRAILSPAVDMVSHRDHLHLEIAVEYPEEARKEKEKKEKLRQRRLALKRKKARLARKNKKKRKGGQEDAAAESAAEEASEAADATTSASQSVSVGVDHTED